MFDALLSKFKKSPAKAGSQPKSEAKKKSVSTKDAGGTQGNALLYGSIGLIVIGVAAIAFEAITSNDTPQQTITTMPAKPAASKPAAPKPAPASASAPSFATASAPVSTLGSPK
jgi:hypothetical protein